MAGGNWSGLDWEMNSAGEISTEWSREKLGNVILVPYKSWLYVHVEGKEGTAGTAGEKANMLEFHTGHLHYLSQRANIIASPGPKRFPSSIYYCAWRGYWTLDDPPFFFRCGISTYGYDKDEWVGVRGKEVRQLAAFLKKWNVIYHNYEFPLHETELAKMTTFLTTGMWSK